VTEPPSKGLTLAIRRRARRVAYRIQDGAIALKRAPAWIGSRARHVWFELSLRVRRGVVIGAAIVAGVAAFWLLAVPALPCQFPAGDRCPPPDDVVGLIPGDALLYLHVNTDDSTEQYQRAVTLAGELPTVAQQIVAQLPGAAGAGIEYGRDVRPWLGGEAAITLIPAAGDDLDQALLLEVGDEAGAQRFVDELVGKDARNEDYNEVAVTSRGDVATATVAGFLVLGPETAVRRVIDTDLEAGRSLDDSAAADDVRDELSDDSLVQAYVSEQGARDLFRAGAPLGSFEAFVNSDATTGTGAALTVGDDELEIETASLLDSERLSSSPGFFDGFPEFEPVLADELSARSLAYLGLGDPEQSAKALITQAQAEAPGLFAGFEDFSQQLADVGKVNFERELLPLLGGEVALGIEPPPGGESELGGGDSDSAIEPELPQGIEPGGPAPLPEEPGELTFSGVPYLSFVADEVDEEAARKALADLQVPISEALDPGEGGQAPVFEGTEIEGLQARSLRISPTVNLTYATFDDKLVVATDPAGVKQIKAGDSSLDDADGYERATDGFADELSALLLYFNVGDLLALAEQEGLGADPAYALFAQEIRKLEGMGLAVESDEDLIEADLRLTIEE